MIPSPWHHFLRSLSSLIGGRPSRGRPFRKKAAHRARLGIELLEDRLVPAAVRDLAGFAANTLPPTDDGSTAAVALGFDVGFFGTTYNALYVNNNGNVTFADPLEQWVPFELTGASIPIIAPFFADVDTLGSGSLAVTYGQDTVVGHAAFGINWVGVGYFPGSDDLLNSFQLVLIDRSDVAAGAFDIEFNYDQVQWDTTTYEGTYARARAGYAGGVELAGSGESGAFLDNNPTGLIYSSLNSAVLGRYVFEVRGAGGNQTPVAADDSYGVDEDGLLDVAVAQGVLSNDSDPDEDVLTAALVADVEHGALLLQNDGSFTYTPAADWFGTDSFTYEVSDGRGGSATATVTITVNPVNDAPILVTEIPDQLATEDEPFSFTFAENSFADVDAGDTLTYTAALTGGGPLPGWLSFDGPSRTLSGTPGNEDVAVLSITVTATDAADATATDTFDLTVSNTNDAPQASEDNYDLHHNGSRTVAANAGLLANDSDPDEDVLTAVLETGPVYGTLSLESDGSFTYTPNANFIGVDSFTYRAYDATSTSEATTVWLTVVNELPVAGNNVYSILGTGTTTFGPKNGVLANDTDVDDGLTAFLVSGPSNGTLTLNPDGSFEYTPGEGFAGSDSFTYTANDGTQDSNLAIVTLTVGPVAYDDTYSVIHDTTLGEDILGVLSNDADGDESPLTAVLVSGTTNGTLTFNPDGSFTYEPDIHFLGVDSFTYYATDGSSNSDPATVTIEVTNSAPVASDDGYSVFIDTPLMAGANGVLVNDGDFDVDTLEATLLTDPSNGALAFSPDGTFTYTPNTGYVGPDSFTYFVTDGVATSEPATVYLNVHAVNDGPVISDDIYYVNQDGLLGHVREGVLANDYDPDGDQLSAILVDNVEHGTLQLSSDGTVVYIPEDGFVGEDTFTYLASDGLLFSVLAIVTISVQAAPPPPPVSEFSQVVRDNFPVWDAAKTGKTDGLISGEEIDLLMQETNNDAILDNPGGSTPVQWQEALMRLAAITTMKAALDFIPGLSDDALFFKERGITLADMNKYDAVLVSIAQADKQNKEKAQNANYTYVKAKIDIEARALDPNRYQLYSFVGGVPVLDYTSIQQGAIGDCYFVAPIVSLVANGRSKEIVAMIQPLQGNTKFKVTFPGKPAVFVNRPTYGEVAFYSVARQNGMWLTVIEKAYGTLRQKWFYSTLEPFDAAGGFLGLGGFPSTAIKDLTDHGAKVRGITRLTSLDALKTDIQNALAQNKLVTASSAAKWPWTRTNTADLPRGHAYTILAYNPNLKPAQGGTLEIRNPWGQEGIPGFPYGGTFLKTLAEFKKEFAELTFEN